MPETAMKIAETLVVKDQAGVLDDALRSLRVSGSVLLRESYAAPWAISVPDAMGLAGLLGLQPGVRPVAFHLVEYGHCEVRREGRKPLILRSGNIAICFGAPAHGLGGGRPVRPQALASLVSGESNRQGPSARSGGDVRLICGVFLLAQAGTNPLVAALPPVLHATFAGSGEWHDLAGVARLLAEEMSRSSSGAGFVVERLLEVMCAHVIRAHVESREDHGAGWIRAIRDPVVGRSIAAVHAAPGDAWTVPRLAKAVSLSPSRFAARFSAAFGDSPMAYVARWRMNVACRLLADSRMGVEQVAAEVGYESAAAFSRAFKKHLGAAPADWRAQQQGAARARAGRLSARPGDVAERARLRESRGVSASQAALKKKRAAFAAP